MPTLLRIGPYRFFFYSGDQGEPPHVHVERDENEVKVWLEPVKMQRNNGFSRKEVNKIRNMVEANQIKLLEYWDDFFRK
jgi:hypothetical protein